MSNMIAKNEVYTVVIDDLGHQGEGIAHLDHYTIFIAGALIGEEISTKIISVREKKGIAYGCIVEILKKSRERTEPKCKLKRCGGCDLHHISYKEQLRFKQGVVTAAIERLGGIKTEILPVSPASNQLHYRNKSSIPIRAKATKRNPSGVTAGYFAKRTHEVVPFEHCLIHPEINDTIKDTLLKWMEEGYVAGYNEEKHTGHIRHLVIRHGAKEIMVIIVGAIESTKGTKKLVDMLRKVSNKITSIYYNVNAERGNQILGKKHVLLYGKKEITTSIDDLDFQIGPNTFFQVNTEQTRSLYHTALHFAQLTGSETVIDAYCGVGSIALFIAKHVEKVIGIESNEAAVKAAHKNAELNNITHAEFIAGAAEDQMPLLYEQGIKPDLIIMDPPRKGCDERFLAAAVGMAPKRMIYISCHPGTLARDLKFLETKGYKTIKVQPVDLFPFTHHIESVVLIEKV